MLSVRPFWVGYVQEGLRRLFLHWQIAERLVVVAGSSFALLLILWSESEDFFPVTMANEIIWVILSAWPKVQRISYGGCAIISNSISAQTYFACPRCFYYPKFH